MNNSVALCTCNGEKYLRFQLDSIIDQSHAVSEIVICDDKSEDNTLIIIEEYSKKRPGLFKVYENPEKLGTIGNFRKAVHLCSGDIIFLSDQDDIWEKDKVEKMMCAFNERKHVELIFTDGRLINDNGDALDSTLWQKWDFNKGMRQAWRNNVNAFHALLHNNNRATGATIAFRRRLLERVGNFTVPLDFWHDALLALHAAAKDGLWFIEEPLIRYRIHSGQQVGVSQGSNFNAQLKSQAISLKAFQQSIRNQYPLMFSKWHRISKSIKNIILRK